MRSVVFVVVDGCSLIQVGTIGPYYLKENHITRNQKIKLKTMRKRFEIRWALFSLIWSTLFIILAVFTSYQPKSNRAQIQAQWSNNHHDAYNIAYFTRLQLCIWCRFSCSSTVTEISFCPINLYRVSYWKQSSNARKVIFAPLVLESTLKAFAIHQ